MHPNDDCDDEDNGEDGDKGEDEDQHCQFPHDLSSSFGSLGTGGWLPSQMANRVSANWKSTFSQFLSKNQFFFLFRFFYLLG